MPEIPFRYYMLSFKNYLAGPQFLETYEACDAASCFLGLVLDKLDNSFDDIAPILSEIMPTVEYVAKNQVLFDADVEIYGDFNEKLSEIKQMMNKAKSSLDAERFRVD